MPLHWAPPTVPCPFEECSHACIVPAQRRPADLDSACTAMKDHITQAHPDATDAHWASAGFAKCPVLACSHYFSMVELPAGGEKRLQWRSACSNHISRTPSNRGNGTPAGHHEAVRALGGNSLVTRLAIDRAHACAPVDTVGHLITVNGVRGGFNCKAAHGRATGSSPRAAPHISHGRDRPGPDHQHPLDDGSDEVDDGATRASTTPADGLDLDWARGVALGDVRGLRVKIQALPTRRPLCDAILQPEVYAAKALAAAVAAHEAAAPHDPARARHADAAEAAFKYRVVFHAVLLGRARGAPRLTNATLRQRAARAAAGGLQQMWEECLASCGTCPGHGGAGLPEPGPGVTTSPFAHSPDGAPQASPRLAPDDNEADLSAADTDLEDDAPAADEKLAAAMKKAQHWVNQGCMSKALGVFTESAVGNPRDNPDLLKSLLDLTPYAELPTAEQMADVPGTPKFVLKRKVFNKYMKGLPSGRAVGTLHTNYEVMRASYEAGAADAWFTFYSVFCRGALPQSLVALICLTLRAVMLKKAKGWRPLGIKEAECRIGCGLYATQRRHDWNEFYTEDLKADREARAAAIHDAETRVQQLQGAVAAVSTRNADAALRARVALADANIDLERARAPTNYPIQLCYAETGADLGAHALEGFLALAPEDDLCQADTTNMYNECQRPASFDAFKSHDPVSIPIYRMCYGQAADIYVQRTAEGSTVALDIEEVLGRADRLGLGDRSLVDPDDAASAFERELREDTLPPIFAAIARTATAVAAVLVLFLSSTRGWHQGCALATHGACCPYHLKLHSLKRDYSSTRVICFGDDTYGSDRGGTLYRWLEAKEQICLPIGHVARADKETCYSPASGCPHAPASIPGSPRHEDGLLQGFKGLGAFFGDATWCRRQLAYKLVKRLSHLDGIDAMRDVDGVDNAKQLQQLLVDGSSSSVAVYSLRAQSLDVTLGPLDDETARALGAPSAAHAVDIRVGRSLDALTQAEDSPPDLRAVAQQQMRLSKDIGGMGKASAAALAPHARCASRLATAMRLHRWIPLFAAHDPLTDPHPFFSSFRDHYEDLRARRAALAAKYAELDKDVHHLCDGLTTLLPQRPSRLPEAKSLPPISSILAADCSASVFPPKQAKLASIARHEDWWACLAAWQAWDAAHPASDISARGATNFVAMSQHGAGQWLNLQPRTRRARIQSVEYLYALQRRFGLYISAAIPAFAAASRVGDNYDPWCDRLSGEPGTDKSAPHNGALRVLHDCHQATVGGGTVVLGDKSHAEVWKLFNDGCCMDIGERGQAAGGRDLVVEVKAWAYLHADSTPRPHADLARRGATHGFGDTLEHAIRKVRGVRARHGDERWSHARGIGRVAHHPGDYDDAQRRKHNELVLFLVETSGALSPPARRHLRWLHRRSKGIDRTPYDNSAAGDGGAKPFVQFWTQRLSAAVVTGDARRTLNAISACAVRSSF